MLSLIDKIAGRPWAVDGRLAAQVRAIVVRDGFSGLRALAELKGGIHAFDEDERNERQAARRGGGRQRAGGIAVVRVIGTMTQRAEVINSVETRSTASVAEEVAEAVADSEVDAVVLEIDSPGGEVFGVPEAWAAIRAAAKQKPVVASANSLMASAALYVASAASEIWVTPSGEVGSVGVYALHVDASKALEDMGEKWEFVEADDSPYKVEGNPAAPLSVEGRAQIKKAVNRYMGYFVRDLAKGRGVSEHHVKEKFGKGRMLGPEEAVAARLVDRVGTLEQAIRRAGEMATERRRGAALPAAEVDAPEVTAEAPEAPAAPPTAPVVDAAGELEARSRAAALEALRGSL
jgi:signal peptide peptidase SppA